MKSSYLWFLALIMLAWSPISRGESIYVGVGALAQNMGSVATSDDASKSLIGPLYVPTLSVAGRMPVFGILDWMPSLLYTPIARKGRDGVEARVLSLQSPFLYSFGIPVQVKFGPGLFLYTVSGKGGSLELNNGTSTSTFYRPDSGKTSRTFFLDLGVGVDLPLGFRVDFDIWAISALSSRRAYSGVLQISKGFL